MLSKHRSEVPLQPAPLPPSITITAVTDDPVIDASAIASTDPEPFTLAWVPLPNGADARIVEAIYGSPSDGRSAHVVFTEKEKAVGAIFAGLSVREAQALHRRLTLPATDDPVAAAFERLTKERRDRLIRFLGDARRRVAQTRARR